jgi:malate/lactate dehydrogenase
MAEERKNSMRVIVLGAGNTAAAILLQLAEGNFGGEIRLVARNEGRASAIICDIASAYPSIIDRIKISDRLEPNESGIVIVTAGKQIPKGKTARDLLNENAQIALDYVQGRLTPTARVVLVSSPVDEITATVAKSLKLPFERVIGFGGDLDVRRLAFVLRRRGIDAPHIHVVGEHGARAIPVYDKETEYDAVAHEVRQVLATISAAEGSPRNLATGVLVRKLIASLVSDIPALHHVTTYCSEYASYLTWPCLISRNGAVKRVDAKLGENASRYLAELADKKRIEAGLTA